jgi:hypothetical protein
MQLAPRASLEAGSQRPITTTVRIDTRIKYLGKILLAIVICGLDRMQRIQLIALATPDTGLFLLFFDNAHGCHVCENQPACQ